jgi:hypothetical protein
MTLVQIIDFLRDRWPLLVKIFMVILALLVIADAIPFIVDKEKAHTAAERIPGFWSVFGFISCVIIIYVSKIFGGLGIMRIEDYYNDYFK